MTLRRPQDPQTKIQKKHQNADKKQKKNNKKNSPNAVTASAPAPASAAAAAAPALPPPSGGAAGSITVSLADILAKRNIPEGFDVTKKELYLSDAEFQATFNMSKEAYKNMPKWKQNREKKKHNLF